MGPGDLEKEAKALGVANPEDREAVLDALCQRRYMQLRRETLRNVCRDHKLGYVDKDTKETMSARLEAARERAAQVDAGSSPFNTSILSSAVP